jgi:hypothetical protein
MADYYQVEKQTQMVYLIAILDFADQNIVEGMRHNYYKRK